MEKIIIIGGKGSAVVVRFANSSSGKKVYGNPAKEFVNPIKPL